MSPISRGFRGHRPQVETARLPPGQHVVEDFPVLSAGPTPHTPLAEWTFVISGAVDRPVSWTWEELLALPAQTPTVDIHCVTKWSKLGTTWKGVSVDTLLAAVDTDAEYVNAWCDGGYTTNLPLEDVTESRAWIAYEFDGEPLHPEHGGACATPGAAPVLLEEREAGARTGAPRPRQARLLGNLRLPQLGDPWKEQRYQGG
jgi:DMSO/TMAO reductase YedYZ molybdopterin-dependent catalytic subunit